MRLLQAAGRVVLSAVAIGVLAVVGLQFARVLERNVVLANELGALHAEVSDLGNRRAAQERTIRRLKDPHGAVPEIHDRLLLTRPDEAIIYVKGADRTRTP